MLFNDNMGGVGLRLPEVIENCPVDGSRYTVASSFIPGDTGSNVTKCLVGWSARLNCITIWNSEEDVVYAPADKAVIDDDAIDGRAQGAIAQAARRRWRVRQDGDSGGAAAGGRGGRAGRCAASPRSRRRRRQPGRDPRRLLRLHAEAPLHLRADRRDVARGQHQRAAAEDTAREEERHAGRGQGTASRAACRPACGSTSTGRSNR